MGETEQVVGSPYKYIDVHRVLGGGQHTKWTRITEAGLQAYVDKVRSSSKHIYSTVQSFANALEKDGESYICPLFFDFDYKEELGQTLDDAKDDTKKLIDYFLKGFHVDEDEGINVAFTGNRGFHILIDHQLFDANPSDYLVKVWRNMAEKINAKMEFSTFDRAVYTKRRMWRVLNTKHGGSGLYKIPLHFNELLLKSDKIRELASEPREDVEWR